MRTLEIFGKWPGHTMSRRSSPARCGHPACTPVGSNHSLDEAAPGCNGQADWPPRLRMAEALAPSFRPAALGERELRRCSAEKKAMVGCEAAQAVTASIRFSTGPDARSTESQ